MTILGHRHTARGGDTDNTAGQVNRESMCAAALAAVMCMRVGCHQSRMQADADPESLRIPGKSRLHVQRGLACQPRMAFECLGSTEQRHDAVSERAHDGTAEALDRVAHE